MAGLSLFQRLKQGLTKSKETFVEKVTTVFKTSRWDAATLDTMEEVLIGADVGVKATDKLMAALRRNVPANGENVGEEMAKRLQQAMIGMLQSKTNGAQKPALSVRPWVILFLGVNGVGKTTTIGKLAKRLQMQGHSVMLAAGDTFRAAAVEQLQTWGERNQVPVIAQHTGADSASVIYDAVQAAQARGVDVLIADTAGRLHTQSNLMDELAKIRRVIGRLDETAPHEVLLVLDASTGQNALSQARVFNEAVSLTGLALTKLDGTAKGGVIFALARQFGIPIRFIGVGESIDDLQDFEAERFIEALFADTGKSA